MDERSEIGAVHPEAFCGRCGRPNPVWVVPSDRYNTAVNRSEIVCPTCFITAHEAATGMRTCWELVPSRPFRWIEDDARPTPYLTQRLCPDPDHRLQGATTCESSEPSASESPSSSGSAAVAATTPEVEDASMPTDLICVGRFGLDGLDGMGALAGEDIYVTKEAHVRATGVSDG